MSKKMFFLFFFCLVFSLPVLSLDASGGVYLTEPEFQELMNIITQSTANSKAQTKLISELKQTLKTQEAELKSALNNLKLSEADLAELKTTLAKIQSYSLALEEYCKGLESENKKLKRSNAALKIGCGAGGGAAVVLLILLFVL